MSGKNATPEFIATLDSSARRLVEERDSSVYSKEATHADWARVRQELEAGVFGRYVGRSHRDEDLAALIDRLFPGASEEKDKKK